MTALTEWQTFYEIVGSAAGALTGLQFVAMAIIADVPMPSAEQGANAFASPTIVHFVAVLLLAASAAMPWHGVTPAGVVWGVAGVSGLGYALLTARRMQTQNAYQPVLEDWLFHAWLPMVAYAGWAVSGFCMISHPGGALFGLAGVSLLLLVISIHNSWDNLTYLVFVRRRHSSTSRTARSVDRS